MIKHETLPKGVGVSKFDLTKSLRNQLFYPIRVLYLNAKVSQPFNICFLPYGPC